MRSVSDIKRAQKESQLLQTISELFRTTALDDPELHGVFVSRVQLSPNKGSCWVFFYTEDGEEAFNVVLERLKLYKPSLRKALARALDGRYTPDILFKWDAQLGKQLRLEHLIEQVKEDSKSFDDSSDQTDTE